MSDLDPQPSPPPPRPAGSGTAAVTFALLVLAAAMGGASYILWEWREESRAAWAALEAKIVAEPQLRAIVADGAGARPVAADGPAVARAVVDMIKIELPPLLAPINVVSVEPAPAPPPEAPSELVLRQTVPFPRIGSDGDGEVERAIAALTSGWRKHGVNGGCELAVEGHTDTKGSDDANRLLSERRATFVSEILAREFAGAKIKAQGWGERRLQVVTADGVDELANRRVEVTLTCPPQ